MMMMITNYALYNFDNARDNDTTRKHRQSYRHADPRRQQQHTAKQHASLANVRP